MTALGKHFAVYGGECAILYGGAAGTLRPLVSNVRMHKIYKGLALLNFNGGDGGFRTRVQNDAK